MILISKKRKKKKKVIKEKEDKSVYFTLPSFVVFPISLIVLAAATGFDKDGHNHENTMPPWSVFSHRLGYTL